MIFLFIDLKYFLSYSHSKTIRGVAYVHWKDRILTSHGLSADV
jgi:hypothetical protein